jgi:plasmid replication initiation protein
MGVKINKNRQVVQSNKIIEASYKLTLAEKRLILCCLAQIESSAAMRDSYAVTAKEYADMFGLSLDGAYEWLQQTVDTLFKREIWLYGLGSRARLRWVSKVVYYDGQGRIELQFTEDIKPYLSQLRERFTVYRLRAIADMQSQYSIRIYEILMQFSQAGQRQITVAELRRMLALEDSYSRFSNLRAWIIDPATEEINAYSDLTVTYRVIKKGRTPWAVEFSFSKKKQAGIAHKRAREEMKEENERKWKQRLRELGVED